LVGAPDDDQLVRLRAGGRAGSRVVELCDLREISNCAGAGLGWSIRRLSRRFGRRRLFLGLGGILGVGVLVSATLLVAAIIVVIVVITAARGQQCRRGDAERAGKQAPAAQIQAVKSGKNIIAFMLAHGQLPRSNCCWVPFPHRLCYRLMPPFLPSLANSP